MRVYKINNEYIDLDHVLSVTTLGFDKQETCYHADAYFYVTLAFRNDRKMFAYRSSWRDLPVGSVLTDSRIEEDLQKAKQWYADFLKAWGNKIAE